MKIKKSFVAFGVFLALAGTFCAATLPKFARRAEALVLVKDPANIAEAIKIVTNTLDILSAEQQQIVLQLLNMKKLDPSDLTKFRTIFLKDQTTSNNIVNGEGDYALSGILSGKLSIPTSWDSMLGSVTDILNGQGNDGGCFGTGKPGLILLSRVGKDAVVTAKMAQQQDLESGKVKCKQFKRGIRFLLRRRNPLNTATKSWLISPPFWRPMRRGKTWNVHNR